MKEITAYVHRSRVADVIAALKGCPDPTGQAVAGWITVTEVVQAIAIH